MNDCVGCASSEIENRSGNSAYAELLVHDAFQRCAFRTGEKKSKILLCAKGSSIAILFLETLNDDLL
jgi:hypothetical protein